MRKVLLLVVTIVLLASLGPGQTNGDVGGAGKNPVGGVKQPSVAPGQTNGVVKRPANAAAKISDLLLLEDLALKKDVEGVRLLLEQGRVLTLHTGTEVQVLDISTWSRRSYVKVRPRGENTELWMDRSDVKF